MIDIIVAIDCVALVASFAAFIFMLLGWRKPYLGDIKLILISLLALILFGRISNALEWSGIMRALDAIEDFIEALEPVLWIFLLYAFVQKNASADLRKTEQELREAQEELEQRVATRTADLAQSNERLREEIQERKIAQGARLESETFIRAVMDCLPIGVAVNAVDPSVKFEYMNDNFPRFYRTTKESLADPDSFWNAVYEEHEFREKIKKTVLEDCASGDPARMFWIDVPITRKGEETSFITARNIPIPDKQLMVSTVWDVTDRKRAEEALRREKEFTDTALDNQSDTFFLFEPVAGKAIRWNKAFKDITGYTDKEIASLPVPSSYFNPDTLKRAIPFIKKVIAEGSGMIELDLLCKDGREIPIEYRVTTIYDHESNVTYVTSIGRDITERKKAEREKIKLEAQLRQAIKMEAIGTLAGGIAHDFNNILTPILVQTELAQLSVSEHDPVQANLDEVLKAGHRAKNLVKQILTFSRQSDQQAVPMDLAPIIKESLKLLRSSLPKTIAINQDIDEAPYTVFADPTQMHQIVMNLCTNAGQAMQEMGSVLEVGLKNITFDGNSVNRPSDLAPGSYVMLRVSDTGSGIKPDVLDKIFDPFFTTKSTGEGTGMGLAVVHGIVRSHGGAITVNSKPKGGTSFNVFLPRIEQQPENETPKNLQLLPTGSESILFVDDEESLVMLGRRMLEALGYDVEARTSSVDALAAFKAHPDKYNLVMTDMTMPNMTGETLAKELLQVRPDMPVIICSGFSHQMDEKKALGMGVQAFIMKPFIMADIATTVRNVLDASIPKKR